MDILIPLSYFDKLKLPIPTDFIKDGDINVYTKLIVMIELFHSVAVDSCGDCTKLPNIIETAEYLGSCRQTTSVKKREYGYDTYSIARNAKIRKRDRNNPPY